ncbi:MAG: methyltransferase [Caulobacter sp.]|nr:methyltransferase [Caulobacter sp.]
MSTTAVFGHPPLALADVPAGAVQTSPLVPGSQALEAMAPASLDDVIMLAPPATVERRGALAAALRALKADGRLIAMAPKDKGGSRLAGDLTALGAAFNESAKRHHRICHVRRPADLTAIEAAIAEAAPRTVEGLGLTQPGVFSWDRIDAGTALLLNALPAFKGAGADFGCGIGLLANKVLERAAVAKLALVDIDRRAIEAARANVTDPRASFHWADLRGTKGGTCWLVANRHRPYEAVLGEHFKGVDLKGEAGGYKVYEARK